MWTYNRIYHLYKIDLLHNSWWYHHFFDTKRVCHGARHPVTRDGMTCSAVSSLSVQEIIIWRYWISNIALLSATYISFHYKRSEAISIYLSIIALIMRLLHRPLGLLATTVRGLVNTTLLMEQMYLPIMAYILTAFIRATIKLQATFNESCKRSNEKIEIPSRVTG